MLCNILTTTSAYLKEKYSNYKISTSFNLPTVSRYTPVAKTSDTLSEVEKKSKVIKSSKDKNTVKNTKIFLIQMSWYFIKILAIYQKKL